MKTIKLISAALFILLFVSCEKEDMTDYLEPIQPTSFNTSTCMPMIPGSNLHNTQYLCNYEIEIISTTDTLY